MRWFAIMTAGALLLSGCVSDQRAAIPPDPDAPFPLANSRILGQPSPGAIIVETRSPLGTAGGVLRAARAWCGGPAQVSPISADIDLVVARRETWVVRCR